MKRYFLCIIILSSAMFSCKKDQANIPTPSTKQYKISLGISGFSQAVAPFVANAAGKNNKGKGAAFASTSTDTLAQDIDVLYYLVYNSSNVLIRSYTQPSKLAFQQPNPNFGANITLKLDPGTYQVIIAGGKTGLQSSPDTANQFVYSPENVGSGKTLYAPFKDTFFKNTSITVGNADANYNVTLNRVVAQLEVDIQDAIPSTANSFKVTVNNDCNILKPDGIPEGSAGNTFLVNNLTVGATNTKLFGIVLNTISSTSVDIQCLDQSNNVIAEKIVTGVKFQPNKTTLLTGDLFGATTSNGISVNYNPAWQVSTTNYTF